ncbi:hypothetical protein FRC09_001176 [Ceratobasidium sp. 395]|nr:hypothetical protein FRC09_001176 [Ceratobasidium sp. 395]
MFSTRAFPAVRARKTPQIDAASATSVGLCLAQGGTAHGPTLLTRLGHFVVRDRLVIDVPSTRRSLRPDSRPRYELADRPYSASPTSARPPTNSPTTPMTNRRSTKRGVKHVSIGQFQSTSGVSSVSHVYTQTRMNAQARAAPLLRQQRLAELSASQQAQFRQLHDGNSTWTDNRETRRDDDDESAWIDIEERSDAANDDNNLEDLLRGAGNQRGRNDHANWKVQIPRLASVLLRWEHQAFDEAQSEAVSNEEGDLPFMATVVVIDVFDRSSRTFTSRSGEVYPNETLIRGGCLASSPLVPVTAFSLDCLQLYRALRSRCSSYSIETFVKTLADLHHVHFHSYHVTQFSRTFAIYDDLQLHLSKDLDKLLGRTDVDWHQKHKCSACSYELDDELPLRPRKMFSMDGNNSLKRLLKGGHEDVGSYTPTYFLSPSNVNRFKNEVTRVRPPTPPPPVQDIDLDGLGIPEVEPPVITPSIGVGPTDGEPLATSCANNWRAAQAQHDKKTPSMFDETGVFLACCRHGLVAVIVDMIRSGELAKYPLAIFDKLVAAHGDHLVVAYDIACSFFKTLKRSKSLGELFELSKSRLIVPAFHAWAHNRLCQISWHPVWQPSLGLEDFEWCERVFSSSNQVARCTRHASQSTRHRMIELHFRRWDNDREGSSARFLFNNYLQARAVAAEYNAHLERLPPDARIADEEVESLVRAEHEYLTNLQNKPALDAKRVDYVSELQSLSFAEQAFHRVWGASSSAVASGEANSPATSDLQRAQRQSAQYRLNNVLIVVERLEAELDITERWTPGMPEYAEAHKNAKERKYRAALDRLQQLLLQRLLELARLNIGGFGYKLRRQMVTATKNRSRAIRTTVTRVNTLAQELGLEQAPIVIEDVLKHQFLAEFDFLQICNEDVRKEKWARQPMRDAVEARLRIRRAKEELTRVEIEARRLATFIVDEAEQLTTFADQLERDGQALSARRVRLYAKQRASLHFHNRIWLKKLFAHPDFDGDDSLGTPKDVYPIPAAAKPLHHDLNDSHAAPVIVSPDHLSDDDSDIEEEDGYAISEFVSNQSN